MSNKNKIISKNSSELLIGIEKVANVITSTLGIGGRCVMIYDSAKNKLRITKDGASVAQNLDNSLENPIENVGAKFIINASKQVADSVGDGSTTVVALTHALIKSSGQLLESGLLHYEIIGLLNNLQTQTLENLKKISQNIDIKEIKQVALIASNNNLKISELLTDMFAKVKKNGPIIVMESKTGETYTEYKQGFVSNTSVAEGFFRTKEDTILKEITMEKETSILITSKKVDQSASFSVFLNDFVKTGKPLIIVANEFDNGFKNIIMQLRGVFNCILIEIRDQEILNDLAIYTGSTLIDDTYLEKNIIKDTEIGQIKSDALGKIQKVSISKKESSFLVNEPTNIKIKNYISMLENKLKEAENKYEKDTLTKRIARLTNGIGIIYIGGGNQQEIEEKKDLTEDAIFACRNALENGVVPGGGREFIYIKSILKSKDNNLNILLKALESPMRIIIENSKKASADLIISKLLDEKNYKIGYNAISGEIIDLFTAGIVNPTSISTEVISVAISYTIQFIQSLYIIIEKKTEEKQQNYNPYY